MIHYKSVYSFTLHSHFKPLLQSATPSSPDSRRRSAYSKGLLAGREQVLEHGVPRLERLSLGHGGTVRRPMDADRRQRRVPGAHAHVFGARGRRVPGEESDLTRGRRRKEGEVEIHALSVHHDGHGCRLDELKVGLLASIVHARVVNLHACDNGVVGLLGVDCKGDELLELGGDCPLRNLCQLHKVNVLRLLALLEHAARNRLLEHGELRVIGVMAAGTNNELFNALGLKLPHSANHRTACTGHVLLARPGDVPDPALGVDANVCTRNEYVPVTSSDRLRRVAQTGFQASDTTGNIRAKPVDVKYEREGLLELVAEDVRALVAAQVDDSDSILAVESERIQRHFQPEDEVVHRQGTRKVFLNYLVALDSILHLGFQVCLVEVSLRKTLFQRAHELCFLADSLFRLHYFLGNGARRDYMS
mmetsp:Transcript_27608/g.65503  ORF Transcript_27608/g.65503 Transcript_27608/m.65503 type:complete len:419 (-) Transcript_27608:238-1494(-)